MIGWENEGKSAFGAAWSIMARLATRALVAAASANFRLAASALAANRSMSRSGGNVCAGNVVTYSSSSWCDKSLLLDKTVVVS